MANPKLFRVTDHAVHTYRMIEEGDRILVGASGGKDSTALMQYLGNRRKRRSGPRFEVCALHVKTDIGSPFAPELRSMCSDWSIPFVQVDISVHERLKPGRSMNCWWCSTQRRTELNEWAIKNGFNKIALGHHLDDILETLLMNALGKGELSTMPPVLGYDKYPITIIRPLCLCDTAMIVRHASESGYISSTCTCTFQDNSTRKNARRKLDALTDGRYDEKRKLFEALSNIKPDYLP